MKLLNKFFKVGKIIELNGIKYKRLPLGSKYKYQLVENYAIAINIQPAADIITDFIVLNNDGLLTIHKGYAWDGASGITIDTDSSIRSSLIHDALYQLMREGKVERKHRQYADELLRDICIEDGMYEWRAKIWFFCVRNFAGKHAGE